jgi:hypothetical protein
MIYANRAFLVSLLAVAGCGGGSGHAAPGDLDAFLTQFLNLVCRLGVSCGSMPDLPTCEATMQRDSTEFATLRADIASGKVRYDAAKASACLDYQNRVYGGACTRSALAAASSTIGSEACAEVLVGSVAEGGPCFSAFECTSASCRQADTTCSRSRQCCPGTCSVKPTSIAVGADCSSLLPGQTCATGAVCISTGSQGSPTCQVPAKTAGASCAMAFECATPLFCALDAAGGTGTCQAPAATGASCNTVVGAAACDDVRDYCDQASGQCTPRVAVGASCDPTQQNCVFYGSCLGGTCVAMSPERGACDATNGPSCLGDLECSSQTFTCGFPAFVDVACS